MYTGKFMSTGWPNDPSNVGDLGAFQAGRSIDANRKSELMRNPFGNGKMDSSPSRPGIIKPTWTTIQGKQGKTAQSSPDRSPITEYGRPSNNGSSMNPLIASFGMSWTQTQNKPNLEYNSSGQNDGVNPLQRGFSSNQLMRPSMAVFDEGYNSTSLKNILNQPMRMSTAIGHADKNQTSLNSAHRSTANLRPTSASPLTTNFSYSPTTFNRLRPGEIKHFVNVEEFITRMDMIMQPVVEQRSKGHRDTVRGVWSEYLRDNSSNHLPEEVEQMNTDFSKVYIEAQQRVDLQLELLTLRMKIDQLNKVIQRFHSLQAADISPDDPLFDLKSEYRQTLQRHEDLSADLKQKQRDEDFILADLHRKHKKHLEKYLQDLSRDEKRSLEVDRKKLLEKLEQVQAFYKEDCFRMERDLRKVVPRKADKEERKAYLEELEHKIYNLRRGIRVLS